MPKIVPAVDVRVSLYVAEASAQTTFKKNAGEIESCGGRVFGILDACEDLNLNKCGEEISLYDINNLSDLDEDDDGYMTPESWYM